MKSIRRLKLRNRFLILERMSVVSTTIIKGFVLLITKPSRLKAFLFIYSRISTRPSACRNKKLGWSICRRESLISVRLAYLFLRLAKRTGTVMLALLSKADSNLSIIYIAMLSKSSYTALLNIDCSILSLCSMSWLAEH